MKVYEAKKVFDDKYSKALKDAGVFFAFSDEQFEQNKTHKNAGKEEYLPILYGGCIHKSNIEKFKYLENVLYYEFEKEYKDNTTFDDVIEYELANYECYYTGDIERVVDVICSLYDDMTKLGAFKNVERVYLQTKDNHYEG